MKEHGVLSGKVKMARNRLTREQRADLVESNRKFIRFVATRCCPERMRSLWLDDIVSEASIRVYKGLKNYRGDVAVESFIRGCVKNTAIDFGRRMKYIHRNPHKSHPGNPLHILSLNNLVLRDEVGDLCQVDLDERAISPDWQVVLKDIFEHIDQKRRQMKEKYSQIVFLYFYEGLTMDQIRKRFRLTQSRVSQIISQYLELMKDYLTRRLQLCFSDIIHV